MSAERSVGIVGGGIGGIAAAVALHQAGLGVIVYEKALALREVGAGMMLWPNATQVLREMGLLESVLACSGPNTHFLVRDSSGTILMNLALGRFEVPALCTRRNDLLGVLLAALPTGCVRLDHDLDGLEEKRDKVRFRFKNGLVEEHDAAIGADGIRSKVRSQLFGAAEPIYRGYTVWRGLAEYAGDAIPAGLQQRELGSGTALRYSPHRSSPIHLVRDGQRLSRSSPMRLAAEKSNSSKCSRAGTHRSPT